MNPRINAIVREIPPSTAADYRGPFAGVLIKDLLRAGGPQARTVRDTAAMLDVISGGEPSGPYLPALPTASFTSSVGADPGRLRIGVRVPSALTPEPHREAWNAVEAAVRALTDLGHHVDELVEAPSRLHAPADDLLRLVRSVADADTGDAAAEDRWSTT